MSQTYRLVATAMLAALCFVLQISNNVLGLQTGFGMTIDLVAVPAILALFIFGFESAFDVLLLATIFIALFAPTGPIGAAMKFAATVPTLIVCAGYMMARKKGSNATALLLVTALSVLASIILFLLGAFAYSYLGQSNSLLFGLLPIAAMALASNLSRHNGIAHKTHPA